MTFKEFVIKALIIIGGIALILAFIWLGKKEDAKNDPIKRMIIAAFIIGIIFCIFSALYIYDFYSYHY